MRATGYQLSRPAPAAPRGLNKTVTRLEKATARLERLAGSASTPASAPAAPKSASKAKPFPRDFDDEIKDVITAVRPYTMTSNDKLHALITATRYIRDHQVPGAVVECGVWRGGSMHAVARTLTAGGDQSRELYLFDTFEGMPPPEENDVRTDGRTAQELLAEGTREQTIWAYASLEDVKAGFETVPYPAERVHFVPGKVEDTVPQEAPESIALLRLDTDWYSSTRHELEHLYPRLVSGGVLILDDYGWWQGARQATDEWLRDNGFQLALWRAGTGRVAIKP
ncbi:TylF/MycF/NovP-related O-methyltransferase [Kineosporia sp. NBRC 101677]|uniref:TylF/MycF/NovP-related O-methyltransferase n=1 Tax=Kineosporia sp. NBRC 101677 TaxID=3032197 RepID=UPI002555F2D8|nr:TylF/MycF/NovP-related O-methyltransferase [Kineosporia sp. NBRC 101677]